MRKVVLLQAPAKFYGVVPIFVREAQKQGIFDWFYVATNADPKSLVETENTTTMRMDKDYQFSSNILNLLDIVEEPVVFLCVEDHIMKDGNDPGVFQDCFNHMVAHPKIGYLRMTYHDKVPIKSSHKVGKIKIGRLRKNYKYYVSLQPGIWRTDYIRRVFKHGEDAWQTELKGANRARKNESYLSAGVTPTVFLHTNFYSKGKFYRRQYVDYCLDHGIELATDRKVYYKKEPIPFQRYLEIRRELKNANQG